MRIPRVLFSILIAALISAFAVGAFQQGGMRPSGDPRLTLVRFGVIAALPFVYWFAISIIWNEIHFARGGVKIAAEFSLDTAHARVLLDGISGNGSCMIVIKASARRIGIH